jgi:uncharacterized protein YaaQ
MSFPYPDRLVILIVSGTQVDSLIAHLAREKFNFTVINSTGGILQEPEVCLLVGFESKRLPILLDLVRKDCSPYRHYVSTQGYMQGEMAKPSMLEAELGGARLYTMNVERFEQIKK